MGFDFSPTDQFRGTVGGLVEVLKGRLDEIKPYKHLLEEVSLFIADKEHWMTR